MTKRKLWYLLVEGQQDPETGVFGNFYAYGNHLGEALDKVIKASDEYRFFNHNLVEASLPDSFDIAGEKAGLIKITDDVYMRSTTYTYPLDDPDKGFIPPAGIVKSVGDGGYDDDLIKECFVAYGADENGIFEFELVLARQNLIDTFIKAIGFLPPIDGLSIYIKDHWESGLTELWVADHFTDKHTVVTFLNEQKENTLENGHLDIVIHSAKGATDLMLDDHKKIQLHTKDATVFNDFGKNIIGLGYKQTRNFYSLEFGYHHFHYRPAGSLIRSEFKEMLTEHNFKPADHIPGQR